MGEVVVGKLAARQDRVDHGQAGRQPVAHRQGNGAVELDHRRGVALQQQVVEADDLSPVGCGSGRRLGMYRCDRGLQRVGTRGAARERVLCLLYTSRCV